jgi:hypothetical protein
MWLTVVAPPGSLKVWLKQGIANRQDMFNSNKDKSAASFCHQMEALVTHMFWNFYLAKNNCIAIIQQPLMLDTKGQIWNP